MMDAERPEQVPLLRGAGGRKHDGACLQCHLHGRQADAAGAGMDQHPLSPLQLAERVERMEAPSERRPELSRLARS